MSELDEQKLRNIKGYFDEKIITHGANYKGVDYNNALRQLTYFEQLTKIIRDPASTFSLNDFGCGYGALLAYLQERHYSVGAYVGYDFSQPMIDSAQELFQAALPKVEFTTDKTRLVPQDYTIAGAIFNLKLEIDNEAWLQHILGTLTSMWRLSTKGMAFNILTKYSDADRMRPDLYYADPCFLFDYCKRNFSSEVALLHDYGIYEFTILVRRSANS